MNKEIIGQKEINLSHDLSGKSNLKKEKREFREFELQRTPFKPDLKTA